MGWTVLADAPRPGDTPPVDPTLQDDLVRADLEQRDGAYVAAMVPVLGRIMKVWFRSEVHGMDRLPAEGAFGTW